MTHHDAPSGQPYSEPPMWERAGTLPPPTPPPVPNPGISEGHGGDGGGGRKHRKWPWVLGGVVALIVISGVAAGNSTDPTPQVALPSATQAPYPTPPPEQRDANSKASTAPKAPPAATATVVPVPPAAPKLTVSQQNAVESARSYLDSQGFSRLGLIGQLTGFEGYSTADATFAVDYVRADWKKQAVRVAQGYLDSGSFSRSGLITQLTQFEKFTRAQATYAADKVGL
jgi:hypothetical protein